MITIYGLFDGERCIYVGRTRDLERRMVGHKSWLKGSFTEFPIPRVLKTVSVQEAPFAERKMIQHYRDKGEAEFNVRGRIQRALKTVTVSTDFHQAVKIISAFDKTPLPEIIDTLFLTKARERANEVLGTDFFSAVAAKNGATK